VIGALIFAALALAGSVLVTLLGLASETARVRSIDSSVSEKRESKKPAETAPAQTMRAELHCASYPPRVPERFRSIGYTDCGTFNMAFGGNSSCSSGCVGLGSCARVCPANAIALHAGSISVSSTCTGCGKCVTACPKNLIVLSPWDAPASLACAAGLPTASDDGGTANCPLAPTEAP